MEPVASSIRIWSTDRSTSSPATSSPATRCPESILRTRFCASVMLPRFRTRGQTVCWDLLGWARRDRQTNAPESSHHRPNPRPRSEAPLCVHGADRARRATPPRPRRRRKQRAGPPHPGPPPRRGDTSHPTAIPSPLRGALPGSHGGTGGRPQRLPHRARLQGLRRGREAARRGLYHAHPRPPPPGLGGAGRSRHPRSVAPRRRPVLVPVQRSSASLYLVYMLTEMGIEIGGVHERLEVHAGLDPHLREHVDQVLGSRVPPRSRRVGAATEPADRGIE